MSNTKNNECFDMIKEYWKFSYSMLFVELNTQRDKIYQRHKELFKN